MSGIPAPSLALLSVITALAFCGLHMVVPALPLLVVVFADTPAHVQLVVSLYLAGIGAGQLVYGPVSDRSGRPSGIARRSRGVSRHGRQRIFAVPALDLVAVVTAGLYADPSLRDAAVAHFQSLCAGSNSERRVARA